jgi:hypothetical protein
MAGSRHRAVAPLQAIATQVIIAPHRFTAVFIGIIIILLIRGVRAADRHT